MAETRTIYNFLFLKTEANEEGHFWDMDSAIDLLKTEGFTIYEQFEDELSLIIAIAPKPADEEKEYRVVALTKSVFLVCDDIGFTEEDFVRSIRIDDDLTSKNIV